MVPVAVLSLYTSTGDGVSVGFSGVAVKLDGHLPKVLM